MKGPGMAKVWKDLASDNRRLLAGLREGRGRRPYSDAEMTMLEVEAAHYEQLASEYEAEQGVADRREAGAIRGEGPI